MQLRHCCCDGNPTPIRNVAHMFHDARLLQTSVPLQRPHGFSRSCRGWCRFRFRVPSTIKHYCTPRHATTPLRWWWCGFFPRQVRYSPRLLPHQRFTDDSSRNIACCWWRRCFEVLGSTLTCASARWRWCRCSEVPESTSRWTGVLLFSLCCGELLSGGNMWRNPSRLPTSGRSPGALLPTPIPRRKPCWSCGRALVRPTINTSRTASPAGAGLRTAVP